VICYEWGKNWIVITTIGSLQCASLTSDLKLFGVFLDGGCHYLWRYRFVVFCRFRKGKLLQKSYFIMRIQLCSGSQNLSPFSNASLIPGPKVSINLNITDWPQYGKSDQSMCHFEN
jgi:hypothetical protein